MPNGNNQTPSSTATSILFFVSLLSLSSSATLTASLYLWGYMGFMGTSSLSITDCSSQYHTTKYSNLTLINQTVFTASATATASGLFAFFLCLCLLVKKCKDEYKNNQISQCHRGTLFIFVSWSLIASTVVTGYYLTHILQANNCKFIYDSTQITVLIVLAGSVLMWSSLMLIIVIFYLQDKQDGFKEIQPNQIKEIQDKITKQLQPIQFAQKQQTLSKPVKEDQQSFLDDERKKYLHNYNSRAPILLAQQDPYEQRQRDKHYIGRVRRNTGNGHQDERRLNRSRQLDVPLRNMETSYYNQPLEEEGRFDLSHFYKRQPLRRTQSSSIMRNSGVVRKLNY